MNRRTRDRPGDSESSTDDPVFTVDLHAHTRFFHGFQAKPTPYDPVGAQLLGLWGRRAGLDGIALTNHDYYRAFDGTTGEPQLIPGIEVTTTAGHLLVVGPDPPRRTVPGERTPEEVVSQAHRNGCAAIVAHPYRRSRVRESDAEFDAVEINGKHPDNAERVRALAESLDVPVVGGSDAHYPFEVGRTATRIEAPELTPDAVVAAIREGAVEVEIRNSRVDELMRTAYSYTHRYL
ncbi:PHP-associated domain-containing protein [Halorubrum sp. N11]|uniref:PHP-associated domain-containing protein n=1 Tax=Halorubrum sp. N11 TaxID=3402276 RepID=UPI003EBA7CD6